MTKNDAPESETTRPMTEEELVANNYPANFHRLAPEDRARIEQQIIDHKMKAKSTPPDTSEPERDEEPTSEPEPEQAEAGTGEKHTQEIPPQYLEARRRAAHRLVTAQSNPDVPSEQDLNRVGIIHETALELCGLIEFLVPECRDKALALTHLEDVVTRASRGIYVKNPIGGVFAPALADQKMEEDV